MLEDYARRKRKEKEYKEEEETKGMPPVGSLMFSEVERRIDVFVFRCCFAHSVYEARRLVIHGYVQLNGKKVSAISHVTGPTFLLSIASNGWNAVGTRRYGLC